MTTNKRDFNKKLKRLAIIQAANELFLEKRYSMITTDDIAQRAGVSKKTFYNYFPSKLSLFIYIFEDYLKQIHAWTVSTIGLQLPTKELFLRFFFGLYEFIKDNEKFMKLFWTLDSDEFHGLIPEELISRVKIWNIATINEMVKLVKRAQKEGVIVEHDPELLVHLLSAISKGVFFHTNKENRFNIADINPEKLFQLCADLFIKGLFKK